MPLFRNLTVLAVAGLLLSACSNKDKDCPSTSALAPDAVSLTQFKNGKPMDLSSVLYNVRIVNVAGDCDEDKDQHSVSASIKINFRATRAPSGEAVDYTVPYFVVLTGPDGKIISKHPYSVQFSFAPGQATADFSDSPDDTDISLGKDEKPYSYSLYVGLQLNKEQLDYNRTLGHFAQ